MTARVVVAGTADWVDPATIIRTLDRLALNFGEVAEPWVLVTGDRVTGVEGVATRWAAQSGIPVEVVPHKAVNGVQVYVRNHTLIQSAPDMVLIFGTHRHLDHLAAKSVAAGITPIHTTGNNE